jgi:predicted nucleic acid-binding Zn ribbon protein
MKKRIEVAGFSRREMRAAVDLAERLVEQHRMCVDCASAIAEAIIAGRHEPTAPPIEGILCSDACAEAMIEFIEAMKTSARRRRMQ